MMSSNESVNYAGLGLLLGTAIGFTLGLILFVATGEAWFLSIGGAGTAIGLGLGASIDRSNEKSD